MRVSRSVRRLVIAGTAIAACVAALSGPTEGDAQLSVGPTEASTVTVPAQIGADVSYSFDGIARYADASGNGHDLSPVSWNGGSLTTVAHGTGRALAFPPPCKTEPCPRIALRTTTGGDLNPGTRPLRYGASVRLAADETSAGENVLQKGFSTGGSQFKLQIDGLAGHPSCVLVGDRSPRIHLAVSSVGVADNRWHTLECRRAGAGLAIRVDGVRRGSTVVPADLAVRNRIPFSVGGKGSFSDNDQFQGTLDDVWVKIGDSQPTPVKKQSKPAKPATARSPRPR